MRALAALLLTVSASVAADPPPPANTITFHQTVDAALKVAQAEKKVTVVYFTASWCSWCRKMQVSTFPDASVTAEAGKFAWARIDVDEEPAAAAKYGARALPHVVLLNVKGQVIASRPGYQTAAQLAKLLAESADKAEAAGELGTVQVVAAQLAKSLASAKDEGEIAAAVKTVLVMVADTKQADREGLADVLLKAGRAAWPGLAAALMDETLAVRAAAGDLLRLATKQSIEYDPFAEEVVRTKHAEAWRKWVASQKSEAAERPEPETKN